jgi:hypothetical protein
MHVAPKFFVQNGTFSSNTAAGGEGQDGLGGAVALAERCPTSETCTKIAAELFNVAFNNNTAKAGGECKLCQSGCCAAGVQHQPGPAWQAGM